jgi:F-type H+-transporting ATPase subunit c
MKRFAVLMLLVVGVSLLSANLVFAEQAKVDSSGKPEAILAPNATTFSGAAVGAGLGAGITIIGAGWGFGRIGAAALEGMARQPEVAGKIQTGMIVIAALLEGATFFALVVCILLVNKATF